MAKVKNARRSVDFSFKAGKLRLVFREGYTQTLSEQDTETLFNFLSTARRRREQALLRQAALDRGEMVVRVQRFIDENGEPRYLVGDEIDNSKLDENGMVSFTSTTRPVGETDEALLARLGKGTKGNTK